MVFANSAVPRCIVAQDGTVRDCNPLFPTLWDMGAQDFIQCAQHTASLFDWLPFMRQPIAALLSSNQNWIHVEDYRSARTVMGRYSVFTVVISKALPVLECSFLVYGFSPAPMGDLPAAEIPVPLSQS